MTTHFIVIKLKTAIIKGYRQLSDKRVIQFLTILTLMKIEKMRVWLKRIYSIKPFLIA